MDAFEIVCPSTVIAYGATLKELFEHAAYAMAALTEGPPSSEPMYDVPVMAIGDSLEELLGDWLRQLALAGEASSLSLRSFVVDRLEQGGVQGAAGGERGTRRAQWPATRVETVVEVPGGYWARVSIESAEPS